MANVVAGRVEPEYVIGVPAVVVPICRAMRLVESS